MCAAPVTLLPPTTDMTPEQALSWAMQCELTDVMVIGFDASGKFIVATSKMKREEALWIAEHARMHALDMLGDRH